MDGQMIHLGMFDDPGEAREAYDVAAHLYHGEFALTNEVMTQDDIDWLHVFSNQLGWSVRLLAECQYLRKAAHGRA